MLRRIVYLSTVFMLAFSLLVVLSPIDTVRANPDITDFYGDSNNVDGGVQHRPSNPTTWSDLMAGPGTSARYTGTNELGLGADGSSTSNLWNNHERSIAIYDTADGRIPATAQVISVTWYIYGYNVGGGYTPSPLDMTVYQAMPQHDNMLVGSDYTRSRFGTTRLSDVTFLAQGGSWNRNGYNAFPFNADGIALVQANIQSGQKTKLGLRSPTYDVGGTTFPWNGSYSHFHAYTRLAPAGMRPYLRIEWIDGSPIPPLSVTSVEPDYGRPNETLDVTITGTNFNGTTGISFGGGITINSYNVDNNTQITANIAIAGSATPGTRDVSVTTPTGTGTLTEGFLVSTNNPPTAPGVDVTPNAPVTYNDLICNIIIPSTDPDGDDVSYTYAWYRDNVLQPGLTTNNIDSTDTAKGEVWKCVVTPNDGIVNGPSGEDEVTIANSPPIADAGQDQWILLGDDPVILDGSGSSDDDGDNLTYQWTQTGGTSVVIENDISENASFNPEEPDNYTFSLVVNDGTANSSPDTVNITVSSSTPPPSGGNGGGGGAPPTPGVTDLREFITSQGVFRQDVTATSEDGMIVLIIIKDTIGKKANGSALDSISILPIEEPPPPPTNSNIIGLVYDLEPDGATFVEPAILTITYDLPEGVSESNLVIAMWDEDIGEWVECEGCSVDTVNNTVSTPVSHFTQFTIIGKQSEVVTPLSPASFSVREVMVSPTEVSPGEPVTISVELVNTSSEAGSHILIIKIDGVIEDTEEVHLPAGGSETVSFMVSRDATGSYEIDVDGIRQSFRVIELTDPFETATFSIKNLIVSPTKAAPGEPVTISVDVVNSGEEADSYILNLRINSVIEDTEEIYLPAGVSKTVSFIVSKDRAGDYYVEIAGQTIEFKVRTASLATNLALICGLVSIGIIIGTAVVLAKRQRSNTQA